MVQQVLGHLLHGVPLRHVKTHAVLAVQHLHQQRKVVRVTPVHRPQQVQAVPPPQAALLQLPRYQRQAFCWSGRRADEDGGNGGFGQVGNEVFAEGAEFEVVEDGAEDVGKDGLGNGVGGGCRWEKAL